MQPENRHPRRQQTLKRPTSCVGIGLHSGRKVKLTLKPAPAGCGILFKRVDLGGVAIAATASHLTHINHATCLANGSARIETVEHLLAALYALSVDNVIVEIDAPEVPIMDGSAAPFVYLIHEAGIREIGKPCSFVRLKRPVSISTDGRHVSAYPANSLRLSYSIDFEHPLLRHQEFTMEVNETSFIEEIAPARTFGFLKDVELMRQNGLALGGSLDNAIVLGETGVLNNPLRYPDEFVRHKLLDLLGDLVLLGSPLLAHVVAVRAGHQLHTKLVQTLLTSPECLEYVEEPELLDAPLAGKSPVTTQVAVRSPH